MHVSESGVKVLTLLGICSRVVAFPVGASLVYISLFFTKGDDGRVQNWLVDLWIAVERIASDKRSRPVVFFNQTASLVSHVLDGVFGSKSLSAQFALTSTNLSICSLYVFSMVRVNEHAQGRFFYAGLFVASALIADTVIRNPSLRVSAPLTALNIIILFAPGWYWRNEFRAFGITFIWYLAESAAIAFGILLDAAFVAAVRALLRKQETERELRNILGKMAISLILGTILIAPSLLFVRDNTPFLEMYKVHPTGTLLFWSFVMCSTTNLFAVLCAFSLLITSVIAVGHRIVWSAASRLVHVCYERRVVENRILLFTIGAALLSYSTHWFDWVRQIPH